MSNGMLDIEGYTLVLRYAGLRAQIATLVEEKDKVRAELSALLDDTDHAFYNGSQVLTVTRCRPRRFDAKAFREDHPGLHEHYLRSAQSDEVRLTVAKDLPGLD